MVLVGVAPPTPSIRRLCHGAFLAGCWGAHIFPRSNLIVASDIQGGLFVIGYTGP